MRNHPLVLFDGFCNLCNGTVGFILKNDGKKQFRFVAFQSEAGKKITEFYGISPETDSVLLIVEKHVFAESAAVIEIARRLPFPWKTVVIFETIPKKIRDKIYRWIARNRYKWFGKRKNCRVPTAGEKHFFPVSTELDF
jgi:predicted DCC family thiol-disulfide oxidoreductase YuxK